MNQVSSTGKEFIRAREGVRLTAYWDGIYYAIGYGNTFYESGAPVRAGDKITQERANTLFDVVVQKFADQVARLITSKVTQPQFDALVSYAYNRGVGNLQKSTLLQMVNANPNNPAIAKQFEIEWGTNQTYKNGLIKRRQLEAQMYFSEYSATTQTSDWLKTNYMFILILIVIISLKYNLPKRLFNYVKHLTNRSNNRGSRSNQSAD